VATFHLNAAGRKAVMEKLKRRVNAVKQETAFECSEYLLNFGYHAKLESGPDSKNGPGWSFYYAASWNQGLNKVNRSIISPGRKPFDEKGGVFFSVLESKKGDRFIINEAAVEDTIFVTNSVYYGKWLNDGGELPWTFLVYSHPNRFLELCYAHLKSNISIIVKNARKNY
jgi:hypothetical protein